MAVSELLRTAAKNFNIAFENTKINAWKADQSRISQGKEPILGRIYNPEQARIQAENAKINAWKQQQHEQMFPKQQIVQNGAPKQPWTQGSTDFVNTFIGNKLSTSERVDLGKTIIPDYIGTTKQNIQLGSYLQQQEDRLRNRDYVSSRNMFGNEYQEMQPVQEGQPMLFKRSDFANNNF